MSPCGAINLPILVPQLLTHKPDFLGYSIDIVSRKTMHN
jgi:hypothetical protein